MGDQVLTIDGASGQTLSLVQAEGQPVVVTLEPPGGGVTTLAGDNNGPSDANVNDQASGNVGGVFPIAAPVAADTSAGAVAGSGAIRIPNGVSLNARNAGGTADIEVAGTSGNAATYATDAANTAVDIGGSATATISIGTNPTPSTAVNLGSLDSLVTIQGALAVEGATGTPPAATGAIRLAKQQAIKALDDAGTGDLSLISATTGDVVQIANDTLTTTVQIGTAGPAGVTDVILGSGGSAVGVPSLAGVGTRPVTADLNGVLGVGTAAAGGITAGLAAARPAATGSGALYLCTDLPAMYFDFATGVWLQFSAEYMPSSPNLASAYTTVSSLGTGAASGMSLSQYADAVAFQMWSDAAHDASALVASAGLAATAVWAVDFEWTGVPGYNNVAGAEPYIGPCVATGNTSGSVGYVFFTYCNGGTGDVMGVEVDSFTIGGGTNSDIETAPYWVNWGEVGTTGRGHMRLLNDGAQLHQQISHDGAFWSDVFQFACPAGLTQFGFCVGQHTGNTLWQGFVYRNERTVPSTYTVTAVTNADPCVVSYTPAAGALALRPGDCVAVRGVVTSSGASPNSTTGTTTSQTNAGSFVESVGAGTVTLAATSCGVYASGGTLVLLSR